MTKNKSLNSSSNNSSKEVIKELKKYQNKEKAIFFKRFFKTGKGEYGEGDRFLGVNVPIQRRIAKKYSLISLEEIQQILFSPLHEVRLTAVFILCYQYEKSTEEHKKKIFDFYLKHTQQINGWDLVDASAHKIVGKYLLDKDKKILLSLVKSKLLWERRIAMIATFTFIRENQFEWTIDLAKKLLNDKEDLMHKAVGWMLREVGKRQEEVLIEFLGEHSQNMPRVMLRYAIEKFSKEQRKYWLNR